MPTRVRIALAAVLVAFLALGSHLTRLREPIVDGRPLTSWLDNIGQDAGEQQAARAVRTAGTNAIPTLLRMLRQRDPPFKRKLMELAQRQPFIKVQYVPAEMRNEQAWVGFSSLGAGAEGAVPALMHIYEQEISWQSQLAAIRSLRDIGPPARMATPVLLRATTNSHFLVRAETLSALAHINPEPKLVVPVLIKALSDSNGTVRFVACNSLAQLGQDAIQAVPALVKMLGDRDREVQLRAASALTQIDPEAAAKAGVK